MNKRQLFDFSRTSVSLLIGLLLLLPHAFALSPEVQQLATNETKSNAVAVRTDAMFEIEHFEIPLRLVGKDLSERMPAEVRDALIFEKNGELHVRWMINPEDTKWHLEMEAFLKKNGVDTTHHKFFKGYQTASRSYLVETPDGSAQFSLKVSTNKTGGNWTDKKQPAEDAFDSRRSHDHVMRQSQLEPFQNFKMMDEPAAFGVKEIDQGMLVRTLADLPNGKMHYLPGFSAMHETKGAEIARLNGSDNPAKFWAEHYNKPLAKALAELGARTGIAYDSPHSQNFLVELDEHYKPTGRMVLRDLVDVYVTPDITAALGNKAFSDSWPAENLKKGELSAAVGIMHGNNLPSWLSEKDYSQWGDEFYKVYDEEFARFSGVDAKIVAKNNFFQSGRYFIRGINVNSAEMKPYLEQLKTKAVEMPARLDPYDNAAWEKWLAKNMPELKNGSKQAAGSINPGTSAAKRMATRKKIIEAALDNETAEAIADLEESAAAAQDESVREAETALNSTPPQAADLAASQTPPTIVSDNLVRGKLLNKSCDFVYNSLKRRSANSAQKRANTLKDQ